MNTAVRTKIGVLVCSLALGAASWATPKGDHGGEYTGAPRDGPPATSNRQALPDAERAQDHADERRSESGMEHSQARERQLQHPPQRDHNRNEHSEQERGRGKGR